MIIIESKVSIYKHNILNFFSNTNFKKYIVNYVLEKKIKP